MKAKVLTVLIAMVLVGCSSDYAPEAHYEDAVIAAFNHKVGVDYGDDITICEKRDIDISQYEYVTETYLYDDDGNIYIGNDGCPIVFEIYRPVLVEEEEEFYGW